MATTSRRLHTFFVVRESGAPEHILVWDTQDLTVGRAPENDLALDDEELSRQHAIFRHQGDAFAVQNASTSNGTYVNDELVETHTLKNKDVVRIAQLELVFYRTAKNPAQLRARIEYASQLKAMGASGGTPANPDATVLGLQGGAPCGDDFEIVPESDFALDGPIRPAAAARDLDLEPAGPAIDIDPPAQTPVQAHWDLDDAQPAGQAVALQLEIEGLGGDLRRAIESLFGKTIELPSLRIRVKGEDL